MENKYHPRRRNRRSNTIVIQPEDVHPGVLYGHSETSTQQPGTGEEQRMPYNRTFNFNTLMSAFKELETIREEESAVGIFKHFKLADEAEHANGESDLTAKEYFPDIKQNIFIRQDREIVMRSTENISIEKIISRKSEHQDSPRSRRQRRVTFMEQPHII